MTQYDNQSARVLGTVTTEFTRFHLLHLYNRDSLKLQTYSKLLNLAQQEYGNNVNVVNITIKGTLSLWQIIPVTIPGFFVFAPAWINSQKIIATGDVVQQQRMEGALINSANLLIESLPQNAIIAVLSVRSDSSTVAETIVDALEFNLVNSRKFQIVDRRRLDQIRLEQNFHMSGDVDDNTAVSIGNMLGANVVITGEVGNDRLVLRALDAQSGQIIAMAREQF